MSLSNPSLSLNVFEFEAKPSAEEALDAFAGQAIPPIETLNVEPISGWATSRFLLDREITDETCRAGKYLRVNFAKAERKIPKSLLTAYCRMEELAVMKERGLQSLSRKEKARIKDEMKKRMLPKMPPQLTGSDVSLDLASRRLYTDATSKGRIEKLEMLLAQTLHTAMVPLDPAGAAVRLFDVQAEDLAPVVFSPQPNGDFVVNNVGFDFLTWLLYCIETGRTSFDLGGGLRDVRVALDGPVGLRLEAQGAHRVALRDGAPLGGVECQAALMAGKKVSSVKMALQLGPEDVYSAVVEGGSFAFRSLKPPALDANRDAREIFVDRMGQLQVFTDAFYALFGAFLRERTDGASWDRTLRSIRAWLPKRRAQA
ncbi:MAG: recombination-associated protein RdgC [Kiritimatiellae bacterium]|nr:recombination-associated protein RdgC [Kiritimatiellia bacterium]